MALQPASARGGKKAETAPGGGAAAADGDKGGGSGGGDGKEKGSSGGGEKLKRVGDWIFGETLGQGSFGKVKLAHHAKTKEKVAIKIVDKSGIANVEDVERVYRETFILTTLKHGNIIKLFEVLDTPKSIMLVMEYAGGGELLSYVASKHRLGEVECCRLFQQILAGVEYCHRAKIIHRDLKLENVLLDSRGTVKIADFGLSNSIKFNQKMDTNCGTPSYTCPEQISGKRYVGAPADLWSLGVMLFAMLAGFLPFEAAGIPALFRKIRARQYRCPDFVSKEAQDLIDRMLTVDPDKRCTIAELRNHPWMLMEYTELADLIEAQPPVTPEMVSEARALCMAVGDDAASAAAGGGSSSSASAAAAAAQARANSKFGAAGIGAGAATAAVKNGSSSAAAAAAGSSKAGLPGSSGESLTGAGGASGDGRDGEGDAKEGSIDPSASPTASGSGGVGGAGTSSSGNTLGVRARERGASVSLGAGGRASSSTGGGASAPKGFRDLRNGGGSAGGNVPADRYSASGSSSSAGGAGKQRSMSIFDKLSVRTGPADLPKHSMELLPGSAGGGAQHNSRYPRFSPQPGGGPHGSSGAGAHDDHNARNGVRFPPIGASPIASPAHEPLSAGKGGPARGVSRGGDGAAAGAGAGLGRTRRPSEFGASIPSYMQPTEAAQNHLLAAEREERDKLKAEGEASTPGGGRGRARSIIHVSSPPAAAKAAALGARADRLGDVSEDFGAGGGGAAASAAGVPGGGHRGSVLMKTPRAREPAAAGAPVPAYMLDTSSSRQRGGPRGTTDL